MSGNHVKTIAGKFISSNVLFIGLLLAGAVLRLYYCTQAPIYTTDLLRNLGYGKAFLTWGFKLYDMVPFDFSPWHSQFLWPNRVYPYPAVTMLFFALIANIHPSLFFGKLVLTLIEAVNTGLIYRLSRDRLLVLLYWFNPISLWFVSHEGQFEPMVILFMLLAIERLVKGHGSAFLYLGLAIQTKLFPIFLIPYFMARMSWRDPKRLAQEWGWGALSLLPSIVAALFSGYMMHFIQPGFIPAYNPLHWKIGDPSLHPHFPYVLIVAHWLAGVIFVFGCIYGIHRHGKALQWIAPLVFVIFVKLNRIGQFWYLMLTPAFAMTVEDNMYRRLLFILAIVLGIRSLYSIFIGPIGYQNPEGAQYLVELSLWGF